MWIITKDHCSDSLDPRDHTGCRSADFDETRSGTLVHRFRMYDDDGLICYEGLSDDGETEDGFEPMDDFGTPNVGCTSIHYLRGKTWEML